MTMAKEECLETQKKKVKCSRDMVEYLHESDIDFNPALFLVEHFNNKCVPHEEKVKLAIEFLPYFFAKKKGITVDSHVDTQMTFSWVK